MNQIVPGLFSGEFSGEFPRQGFKTLFDFPPLFQTDSHKASPVAEDELKSSTHNASIPLFRAGRMENRHNCTPCNLDKLLLIKPFCYLLPFRFIFGCFLFASMTHKKKPNVTIVTNANINVPISPPFTESAILLS